MEHSVNVARAPRGAALLLALAPLVLLATTAQAKPAPANTYTPYATTADGGEPSIGFDVARVP